MSWCPATGPMPALYVAPAAPPHDITEQQERRLRAARVPLELHPESITTTPEGF